jgi:carbonic anhydrase
MTGNRSCMQPKARFVLTLQIAASVLILSGFSSSLAAGPATVSPGDALKRLMQGNARFVSGHLTHAGPEQIVEARGNVSKGQSPFAVIVGCSDSRVGPEIVFDQGLGDLFVVRTAGEVVDSAALGSIEYAVEHLGSALIVVLGHERCGAVSAAVVGAKEPGHIAAVLNAIEPAVKQTRGEPGDPVENAVRAQALYVAKQLETAQPILAERVHSGKLKIVAARYGLVTGKIELLAR